MHLRRLGPSPVVALTSADWLWSVSITHARLPRLSAYPRVSFTNPFTNTGADLRLPILSLAARRPALPRVPRSSTAENRAPVRI